MSRALLALGSNLGDRAQILDAACRSLDAGERTRIIARSAWHATRPIGGPAGQGEFLNGAVLLETALSPMELHRWIKSLEADAGRVAAAQWAARPLDIDLLLYDDLVVRTEQLEVPHPRMAFRRFVLAPAAEAAPQMVHPRIGWTVQQLLEHLNTAEPYLAITGADQRLVADLARSVAAQHRGQLLESDRRMLASDGNSPSPLLANELELIQQRGRLLGQRPWQPTSRWTISDFWLEESLAFGKAQGLAPEDQQRLEIAVAAAQSRDVRPKLLVLVDSLDNAWQQPLMAALADALRQQTQQPGVGPLLVVDSATQITYQNQIIAAVEAMQ